MSDDIDRLLTFAEATKILGIRPTFAYSLVLSGRLRVVKLGRRTFVRISEVRRFVDDLDKAAEPRTNRAI